MSTLQRKTKTFPQRDWHPADVVAALRKQGWSLSRLSRHHGYVRTALKNALAGPWPHAEALIAEALGVAPWDIWPTRYRGGLPVSGRKVRGGRRNLSTERSNLHSVNITDVGGVP